MIAEQSDPNGDGQRRPSVVVIGGGLTGLATAWWLRDQADVRVLEASRRLGGCIRTVPFDGTPFDVGADAMLAVRPEAVALARAAGFDGDDLVAPAANTVLLWRSGRLRRLPPATVMGVPTAPHRLLASGIVQPWHLVHAALEPVRHRRGRADGSGEVADLSVRALIEQRFGSAIADRLVDPLLGGVYAGDIGRLSAQATVPQLWEAYHSGGSMLRALRKRRVRRVGDAPVFLTIRGGLSRLTDRLATDLADRVSLGMAVTEIAVGTARPWRVMTSTGEQFDADQVVLALPAAQSARVLGNLVSPTALTLGAATSASVAVVALAYPAQSRSRLPDASGVLVARSDQRGHVKAVTFSARKWPHLAEHPNVLVRASVGRIDDDRAQRMDDDELATVVATELAAMIPLGQPPVAWKVARWPQSLPQYDVDHVQWTGRLRRQLANEAPGIHLAGAAYDGVGLAARAAEARELATTILDGHAALPR